MKIITKLIRSFFTPVKIAEALRSSIFALLRKKTGGREGADEPSPGRIFPNCMLLIVMPFPSANQRAWRETRVMCIYWQCLGRVECTVTVVAPMYKQYANTYTMQHCMYTRSIMNVSRPPRGATVAFRLLGESAPRRPVAWDGLACWAGPDRTADCWMNLDHRDPADPEKGRRGEKCGVGW